MAPTRGKICGHLVMSVTGNGVEIKMTAIKRPAGFTLVELLVVIAIISALASLLLPVLQGTLNSARDIICMNNMKQLHLSGGMYADDNKGYYPANQSAMDSYGSTKTGYTGRTNHAKDVSNGEHWRRLLIGGTHTYQTVDGVYSRFYTITPTSYIQDTGIMRCPLDVIWRNERRDWDYWSSGSYVSWSVKVKNLHRDLGYLGYIQWCNVSSLTKKATSRPYTNFGLPQTKHPGSVWLLTDYVFRSSSTRYWSSHEPDTNGYRPLYRVAHLDGHVDLHRRSSTKDYIWESYGSSTKAGSWIDTERDSISK